VGAATRLALTLPNEPKLLNAPAPGGGLRQWREFLEAAERHGLAGVVSKRRDAPYRFGECRDWRKVKTQAWREANRELWRLFQEVER